MLRITSPNYFSNKKSMTAGYYSELQYTTTIATNYLLAISGESYENGKWWELLRISNGKNKNCKDWQKGNHISFFVLVLLHWIIIWLFANHKSLIIQACTWSKAELLCIDWVELILWNDGYIILWCSNQTHN